MKASEMTNKMLADECESVAECMEKYGGKWCGAKLREAAERLRKLDGLKAKLKVAEDALAKLQDRFVSSVHDGTIDPYEALKIAEDALAAIREQGGGKPIRNREVAILKERLRIAHEALEKIVEMTAESETAIIAGNADNRLTCDDHAFKYLFYPKGENALAEISKEGSAK